MDTESQLQYFLAQTFLSVVVDQLSVGTRHPQLQSRFHQLLWVCLVLNRDLQIPNLTRDLRHLSHRLQKKFSENWSINPMSSSHSRILSIYKKIEQEIHSATSCISNGFQAVNIQSFPWFEVQQISPLLALRGFSVTYFLGREVHFRHYTLLSRKSSKLVWLCIGGLTSGWRTTCFGWISCSEDGAV